MSYYERETLRLLQRVEAKVDALRSEVRNLSNQTEGEVLMLDELRVAVERNTSVDTSAVALLNGIAEALRELGSRPTVNPADVKALADQLTSSTDGLAAAVTANTPTAPAPQE